MKIDPYGRTPYPPKGPQGSGGDIHTIEDLQREADKLFEEILEKFDPEKMLQLRQLLQNGLNLDLTREQSDRIQSALDALDRVTKYSQIDMSEISAARNEIQHL